MSDPSAPTAKPKKEKKDKKSKKSTTSSTPASTPYDASAPVVTADIDADTTIPSPSSPTRKRKREDPVAEEIEVDVSLPEPPSKKALRRLKKGKAVVPTATALSNAAIAAEEDAGEDGAPSGGKSGESVAKDEGTTKKDGSGSGRAAYGIWIGNLSFSVTKTILKDFLIASPAIAATAITRIHMPPPRDAASTRTQVKPQNKGFAYVDFDTAQAMEAALALSESMLGGRRVLIKDAKSFAGRPDKASTSSGAEGAGAAVQNTNTIGAGRTKAALDGVLGKPTKRVFVGNLGFDVTKEDLVEHFAKCGEVQDVHMATFEDSGKCKGYAWVTFGDLEASEAAVRGWVRVPEPGDEEDGEEDENDESERGKDVEAEDGKGMEAEEKGKKEPRSKNKAKKPRTRKWFVNRLLGRPLRCEFAEDASTRYRKRFGKDAASRPGADAADASVPDFEEVDGASAGAASRSSAAYKKTKKSNQNQDIQPGAPTDPARRRGRGGDEGGDEGIGRRKREEGKYNTGREDTRYRTGAIAEATGTKVVFD